MRVMTLGQLAGDAPPLPSSDSTLSLLRGEPGGLGKVVTTTLLRAVILAPGVWIGGGRGWRLVGGSLVSSLSITAFLFLWYSMHERPASAAPSEPMPEPMPAEGPVALPSDTGAVSVDGIGRVRRLRRY
jgi:hypothetical protein